MFRLHGAPIAAAMLTLYVATAFAAPGTPPAAGKGDAARSAPAVNDAPVVQYDTSQLPAPVRELRARLMEIAKSGDIEALRPLLKPDAPNLANADNPDPVAFLKEQSGDGEGREILAILLEVLEAGFVHADSGSTDEVYVWPYFARTPLAKLDARQTVELFKLITAGDYEDMKPFGTYLFYRVGIKPDGTWAYFVAGD